MTQAKGRAAASKAKAAAARAEKNGKPKTLDYRGLRLEIPPKPLAEIGYLFTDLAGVDDAGLAELRQFVEALIGAEQLAKVREKHLADEVPLEDLADELQKIVSAAFTEYGMTAGESSASSRS